MKKILFTLNLIFIFTLTAMAQAPQAFKYQAVARDNSGNALTNQSVSFRISLLQGSSSGTVVYSESHTLTTNDYGLANLNVGAGTVISGTFSSISWGSNNYFIKVEMDPSGGNSFTLMGTTQLLSVPYALYAETTGTSGGVTITSTVDNGDGTFTFNYSDGTDFTTSDLTGATGAAGTTGQNIYEVYGTGQLVVSSSTTTFTLIPGLTQTINIPANSKVYVHTDGGIQCTATGNAYSIVDVAIYVDGVASTSAGQKRVVAANTTGLAQVIESWSMGKTYTLSSGNHTFEVRAMYPAGSGASTANVSSGAAPQLQGVLTVTIVKL